VDNYTIIGHMGAIRERSYVLADGGLTAKFAGSSFENV